jgi:hypothetical protein
VWEPDRESGADTPATDAIEVDVPDAETPEPVAATSSEALPSDAPVSYKPATDSPASTPATNTQSTDAPAAAAPIAEPAATPTPAPGAPVEGAAAEPALVEAAAAGAAAQQAAEPRRRRLGRDSSDSAKADDETRPNAPVVVFFILLGIVFAFVFIVAAVSTVTHINDLRQAAGRDPDADLAVYLRAIGDSSGYGVMAVLCWVGAGIIGRLD